MSRQYFRDVPVEPLIASNSAVTLTAATEIPIIAQPSQAAIPVGDIRPGKMWKLTMAGICTTAASGTWTITPRWGNTNGITGISMGVSAAVTTTVSGTAIPFMLEFWCQCRLLGLSGGTNSSVIGWGKFVAQSALTAGAAWSILFGGTLASFDTAQAAGNGIEIGVNASITACTITPQFILLESLN